MRFERSFWAHLRPKFPETTVVNRTEFGNLDPPILEFNRRAGNVGGRWITPQHLPPSIQLNVKLEPIRPPLDHTSTAQLSVDTNTFQPLNLYHTRKYQSLNHNNYAAVELVWSGLGAVQLRLGETLTPFQKFKINSQLGFAVPEDQIIYRQDFQIQPPGTIHMAVQTERGEWKYITPPGEENLLPYWPLGGYYHPKGSINDIQQTYITFKESHPETVPSPVRSSYFQRHLEMNRSFLVDTEPNTFPLSLGEALTSGAACIELIYGQDQNGLSVTQLYQSYDYQTQENESSELEVLFRPAAHNIQE